MKTTKNRIANTILRAALAAALLAAGLLLSCENPFRAGLGARVDIRNPTVELTAPVIGAYIRDEAVFTGTAEDDLEVESVWIKLGDGDYVPAEFNAGDGTWRYAVNTLEYPDGDFKVRLKAVDSGSKSGETGELAFIVKNGKPNLELLIPLIGLFDGANPAPAAFNPAREEGLRRTLDAGGDLKGQALDLRGIDTEAPNGPQIRFWPAEEYSGVPPDDGPVKYRWLPAEISQAGLSSASFSWPLKERDEAGNILESQNLPADAYYRFQVKVRSRDGKEFIYPEELYADPLPENRYVEIYLQAVKEFPLVSLAPASAPEQPHDLIDGLTSFKRGRFVLRISASHSRDIQRAELWYTKEGDLNKTDVEWDDPEGVRGETPTSKYFTYTAPAGLYGEGNYTFTARAWGGGGSYADRDFAIRIDAADPEITLNGITGNAGMEAAGSGLAFDRYTVNGVIVPKVLIADPASGLRTGGDGLREQQWFVVDETVHAAIQGMLAADGEHLWYPDPADRGYAAAAGGVIDGNTFRIDTALLADKTDYYLYVLARDKAYKAGRKTWMLRVDQETDKPRFDFSAGSIDPAVKNPDYDDTGTQTDRFELHTGSGVQVRNKLHSAGTIKLTLREDDGLDLSTLKISAAGSVVNDGGNIAAGADIPFSAKMLRGIFGTNPAGEEALLARAGEITQARLREVLGQGEGAALNDGIYRLTLEVKDLPKAKQKMNDTDPATPDAAASAPLHFWFAVDSVNPVISGVTPAENAYAGTDKPFTVTAVVEDKNGPLVPSLEIYLKNSGGAYAPWQTVEPGLDFPPVAVNAVRDTGETGAWKYDVTFTVDMTGYGGGEPRLMAAAADRFGNTAVSPRTLRIDTERPTVELPAFTKTLSRSGEDNYVNGIVSFTVSAADGYGLSGITWWLWPLDVPFPGAAEAWPESCTPPEGRKALRGYIDAADRPYRAWADTRLLEDQKEYGLYIAARDQALNYSVQGGGSNLVKTLRVDQSTDKPTWKVHNTVAPQGVVGTLGLFLSGALADDDGFSVSGSPVEIRVSESTDLGAAWESWSPWFPVPAGNLELRDGDRTLGINSLNLKDPGLFGPSVTDGHKRYQLRYRDAPGNKFSSDDLPAGITPDESHVYGFTDADNADTAAAAEDVFYFIYDTIPPVTEITFYDGGSPYPGAVYGPENEFRVKGTIEELNLLKITDPLDPQYGNYYIDYSVDGGTAAPMAGKIYIDAGDYPGPQKEWELPPAAAEAVFAPLPDRLHTLTIAAGDGTPKTAMKQASFFKDLTPPVTGFSTITPRVILTKVPVTLKGENYEVDWYADPENPLGDGSILLDTDAERNLWYQAQDDWLKEQEAVDTISYRPGGAPELAGTFTDENSDIQNNSNDVYFEYRLDNNGPWTAKKVAGTGKLVRWTIPLTGLEDGVHSVSIRVKDLTGNMTVQEDQDKRYAFRLDSTAPEQTAGLSDGGIYGKTAPSAPSTDRVFTISGVVKEPNLRSLTVEFAKGGEVLHTKDILLAEDTDETVQRTWNRAVDLGALHSSGLRNITLEELTWEYRVPKGVYDPLGLEGGYTVTVRAVDSGGGGEPETLDFTIDKTPPEIGFEAFEGAAAKTITAGEGGNYPAPEDIKAAGRMNYIYSSSPRITGTAADGTTSLKALESRISEWKGSQWEVLPGEDWQALKDSTGGPMPLGASVTWTKYLDQTEGGSKLSDGLYLLEIRAEDQAWSADSASAGNPAEALAAAFYIDRETPALALSADSRSRTYYSNNPLTNPAGKLTFTGTASDLNGIKSLSGKLKEAPAYATGSGDVAWDGDAWTLTIGAPVDVNIAGGQYTLQLTVTDHAERERASPLEKVFTLDNKPPAASAASPVTGPGNKVTGPALITGTSSDPQGSGVVSLEYYMGPYAETAPEDGAAWRPLGVSGGWDLDEYHGPGGTSLKGSHPWGTGNLVSTGGNVYDWNIQVADIEALTREFRIGGQWYNTADGLSFVTPVDPAAAGGPDISSLRLWLRVKDAAGNVTVTDSGPEGDGSVKRRGDVWINPWGNIPVVTIQSPDPAADGVNAAQGYGGSVFVTGSASDNDYVWEVVYRVIEKNMNDGSRRAVVMNGAVPAEGVDGLYTAKNAADPDSYPGAEIVTGGTGSSQGWMQAGLSRIDTGGSWNFSVNNGGEITTAYTQATEVVIQVAAFDGSLSHSGRGDNLGPVKELTVWFSSGQPAFTGWKVETLTDDGGVVSTWHDLAEAQGHTIRGKFRITGTAKDAESSDPHISKVEWRGEETGAWQAIVENGTADEVSFAQVLDSRTLWDNKFAGTSGTYTVYFRITGALSVFTAQMGVPVNIDNFAPLRESAAVTNPKAAGTDYWFMGTALDTDPGDDSNPPVRNLNRVLAWFTRDEGGAKFIAFDGGESDNPGALTTVTALTGRTDAAPGSPGSVRYYEDDGWRVVIDEHTRADQTVWSGAAGKKDWAFKTDTTKIKDGELFLHYLIYDEAGNVSYYRERLVAMNNSPMLHTVALTTNVRRLADVNGIDPAEGRAEFTKDVANLYETGFAARNYLEFEVRPVTDRGNKPLHYRLAYVKRASTGTLEAGRIYTVEEPGTANWESYGASGSQAGVHFTAAQAGTLPVGASAYGYTEVAALKQEFLTQEDYGARTFTYAAEKFGAGDGYIKDGEAFFLLKVWDSVPGNGADPDNPQWATADEGLQNYDFALIGLTVAAAAGDGEAPEAVIYDLNPYTETGVASSLNPADSMAEAANPAGIGENAGRAGIYNTAANRRELKKSGHIEPRAGSTVLRNGETGSDAFTVDQVSGTVILRGRASDNVLVETISLQFNSDTVVILERDSATGKLKAAGGAKAWAVDEIHWRDGHTVEWAYVWDSETVPAGAVGEVTITAAVKDWGDGTGLSGGKAVNRAPYITGFQRHANFYTGRSRQGWYSFSRGETVTAAGFNLKDGGDSTVTLNGGSNMAATSGQTSRAVSFTVPAGAESGRIELTTGGSVKALNNRNDDGKSWNQENWSYTKGSALWNDTRGAHVWETRENASAGDNRTYMVEGTGVTAANAEHVSMSLNRRTGQLIGSWSVYANAAFYWGNNSGTTNSGYLANSSKDPFVETDILYATDETGSGATQSFLVASKLLKDSSDAAGIWLRSNSAFPGSASSNFISAPADFTHVARPNNWKNIKAEANFRIAAAPSAAASGSYNIAYIDQSYHDIRYAHVGCDTTYLLVLDGPTQPTGTWYYIGNTNNNNSVDASSGVGNWAAIDTTSKNDGGGYSNADYNYRPVVAYHDADSDTVRIAYGANGRTTTAANWTRQVLLSSTDTYYSGSGQYISMVIDRTNTDPDKKNMVHLAFYNSVHDTVVYAYGKLPSVSDMFTAGSLLPFTTEAVDSGFSGGAWTDIALDKDGYPWITYQDANRRGSSDGVRIAYRNPDLYGTGGGGWEAMNVPTAGDDGKGYIVADGRLNIEAWPPANGPADVDYSTGSWPFWSAAVGYQSDRFRIAYYIKPTAF